MYRTSEIRDENAGDNNTPDLTNEKVVILTREQTIDVGSRIEILQMLLGYKWVGEAAHVKGEDEPEVVTSDQQKALELLKKMGLAAKFDWIKRGETYFSWVQFAINEAMLDCFTRKTHPFSVLEEGLVYGFSPSATLAFAGLIPKKINRQKNVVNFYLSGVNSAKYFDEELRYAEDVWQKMKQVAPILIEEAEIEFMRFESGNA